MKKIYYTLCLISLSLPGFALDFFQGSYSDALKKAREENKEVLLYFTAKWCGPCQYMERYIFTDESVSSFANQNYISLKVDIDTQAGKKVYYKYAAQGVPDFYIITPNEEIIKRKIGAMKLNQLKDFLNKKEATKTLAKAAPEGLVSIKINKANEQIDNFPVLHPQLSNTPRYIGRAKPDSLAASEYEQMASRKPGKFAKFMFTASVSKWKPGVKMGLNMSSLNYSVSDSRSIPGFYTCVFLDFTSKKFLFQPGMQLNSKGGALSGTTIRFHYLELPLLLSYKLGEQHVFGCPQAVRFNLIPYGGINLWTTRRVTDNSATVLNSISNIKPVDYGVKAGFSMALGSFEPFIGYDLGLANISNNSSYRVSNRGYYLSFALIFGK